MARPGCDKGNTSEEQGTHRQVTAEIGAIPKKTRREEKDHGCGVKKVEKARERYAEKS